MSKFHKFIVVAQDPVVRVVRCDHNAVDGKCFDADTWNRYIGKVDLRKLVIGPVIRKNLVNLFGSARIKYCTNNLRKSYSKVKDRVVPYDGMKYYRLGKYYVDSRAKFKPDVKRLFDDGIIAVVFLKHSSYEFELNTGTGAYWFVIKVLDKRRRDEG